jgi:folate-dependent phosphoribosylglycinamide formyltransferase PurN
LSRIVDIVAIIDSENIPRKPPPNPGRRTFNRFEGYVLGGPLLAAWQQVQHRYRTKWPAFPRVPRIRVKNVNDGVTERTLDRFAPDLVLVSGTNLVSKRLIQKAQSGGGMMNLHTGLSPYVKGGPNCTNWCLAEGAFHCIGNTVMWIDAGIDTGTLILTEQTPLSGHESLTELHFAVLEHAHDAYVRAVGAFANGAELPGVPQSTIAQGRVYYNAEWTGRRMLRAEVNFARRYTPALFQSSAFRDASAKLRLVSLPPSPAR